MLAMLRPLTAIALLTGCATAISDCPRLVSYSLVEQQQAADELAALPIGSVVAKMVADYGVVRNEIRECRRGL
jgi:hypothetical protein